MCGKMFKFKSTQLNKILIIIWLYRHKYWKTFCGSKWKKFTQARKINVTRIKENSVTCLELEIACCRRVPQDSKLFAESETAPLETVPLTGELMQAEVLKGARDFGTKDFVSSRYLRWI